VSALGTVRELIMLVCKGVADYSAVPHAKT